VVRLALRLPDRHEWVKVFDPRGGGVFVAVADPPEVGAEVRVDLLVEEGGPRVILSGRVLWRRAEATPREPAGCSIGLSAGDREKINFLNGYVRGGLLDRRERRRLPLRLAVTYGGLEGPIETTTRDLNEEGTFLLAAEPLPEGTLVHFVMHVPGRGEPLELRGRVSHTVVVDDDDVPGMGVRFVLDGDGEQEMAKLIDGLEAAFLAGTLPEEVIS
jgi:Tfp pilus assembly protein PilZ